MEVPWPDVLNYAIDGDAFVFEYARVGKKTRTVKILTPFVSFFFCIIFLFSRSEKVFLKIHFMLDCFDRVKEDCNDGKLNGCSVNKNAMTLNASAEL